MDMMDVLRNTHATGGDTVSLQDERPLTGYVVSVYPEHEETVPYAALNVMHIVNYVCDHIEVLKQPDHYLGTWVDNNVVYFDISVCTQGFLDATMLALENNQLAFYDILSKESVHLNSAFVDM